MLANHVLHVHKALVAPQSTVPILSVEVLREYIAQAQRYEPYIPKDLTNYVSSLYATLRQVTDIDFAL